MNRVMCISGMREEGKTTELVDMFKSLAETLYIDRTIPIKTHFIICVGYDMVPTEVINNFIKTHNIATDVLDSIGTSVEVATNEVDLLDMLEDLIMASNCSVCIDDPWAIMKKPTAGNGTNTEDMVSKMLMEFIDKYPNEECDNGIDIIYTRVRNNSN